MISLLSWMPLELVQDIGWTLLHFLWQGLILVALLNAILPLCRNAVVRHNWALGALATMALAPIATFLFIHGLEQKTGGAFKAIVADSPLAPASLFLPPIYWLVVFWVAGIAVLSLRTLGGWCVTQSLARRDTLAVPADFLKRCHALQSRLAVMGPVRFVLSRRVHVPVVIGWLRPVVLIPVSAMAGLSPQQLDALLLHELAHIRRLDTAINVLLITVETLLFYHPAIWWVSNRVRIEREHCCDDVAVCASGDAAMYVEALTALETGKARSFALAANGGRLKHRAVRLLGTASDNGRFSVPTVAGLAFLGLIVGSVAMAASESSYPSSDNPPVTLRPIAGTHGLPPYPKDSAHRGEQGTVGLAVTIGTDGTVARAMVAKPSGHPGLDAAAVEYVKSHWRWQPATRNGRPVVAHTPVRVVFNLHKKTPQSQKP